MRTAITRARGLTSWCPRRVLSTVSAKPARKALSRPVRPEEVRQLIDRLPRQSLALHAAQPEAAHTSIASQQLESPESGFKLYEPRRLQPLSELQKLFSRLASHGQVEQAWMHYRELREADIVLSTMDFAAILKGVGSTPLTTVLPVSRVPSTAAEAEGSSSGAQDLPSDDAEDLPSDDTEDPPSDDAEDPPSDDAEDSLSHLHTSMVPTHSPTKSSSPAWNELMLKRIKHIEDHMHSNGAYDPHHADLAVARMQAYSNACEFGTVQRIFNELELSSGLAFAEVELQETEQMKMLNRAQRNRRTGSEALERSTAAFVSACIGSGKREIAFTACRDLVTELLAQEAEESRTNPLLDLALSSALLRSYSQTVDIKGATDLHDLVLSRGVKSHVMLHNALLYTYSAAGDLAGAQTCHLEACSREKIRPDSESIGILMSACLHHGNIDHALQYFNAALTSRINVPGTIRGMLLRALHENGYHSEAYELYQHTQKGLAAFQSIGPLHAVAVGCRKASAASLDDSEAAEWMKRSLSLYADGKKILDRQGLLQVKPVTFEVPLVQNDFDGVAKGRIQRGTDPDVAPKLKKRKPGLNPESTRVYDILSPKLQERLERPPVKSKPWCN